jgi:hypothetical protein
MAVKLHNDRHIWRVKRRFRCKKWSKSQKMAQTSTKGYYSIPSRLQKIILPETGICPVLDGLYPKSQGYDTVFSTVVPIFRLTTGYQVAMKKRKGTLLHIVNETLTLEESKAFLKAFEAA